MNQEHLIKPENFELFPGKDFENRSFSPRKQNEFDTNLRKPLSQAH